MGGLFLDAQEHEKDQLSVKQWVDCRCNDLKEKIKPEDYGMAPPKMILPEIGPAGRK